MAQFKRLVRFAEGNQKHYGELLETTNNGYKVHRLTGSPFEALKTTDDVVETNKVRSLAVWWRWC